MVLPLAGHRRRQRHVVDRQRLGDGPRAALSLLDTLAQMALQLGVQAAVGALLPLSQATAAGGNPAAFNHRADGGPFGPGGVTVGEHGPEVFRPVGAAPPDLLQNEIGTLVDITVTRTPGCAYGRRVGERPRLELRAGRPSHRGTSIMAAPMPSVATKRANG